MKIFYTASFYGKEKYQKYYDLVLDAISATGVEVLSPEKGNYLNILKAAQVEKLNDKQRIHYEAIRKGIAWAQGVIIEISNEDFQLGHEATLAIQSKKHVLCLSIYEDFSKKIINPYFHGLKYNEYNVEEAVENFVDLVRQESLNQRFNLFLNERQLTYLEKAAKENSVNKSEYIRKLIDNDRKSV
ncbi:MAG: hypothetical protein HY426_05045 [Candidatus Levybacteria bacterium]|nr:hypothetical protein [Candidatus Levybacteria bacterium]